MNENVEVITTDDFSAEIDADWNDAEVTADEHADESLDKLPEADQQKEEQSEPVSEEPAEAEKIPESEPAKADQPELFTVKNRDETRQVTREELIAMAQKGWDYDHIREERDQLRQYRQEADPAYVLVKSYAERNGMDVSQYLDYCRKQELMSQGINEQTANAQVALEKERVQFQTQQREAQEEVARREQADRKAQAEAEARRKDMDAFLSVYPNVKAEAIPKEVWVKVGQGVPLLTAYTMHRSAALEAEIAALKKNNENAARTTGSLVSPAEGNNKDEIDALWYADD